MPATERRLHRKDATWRGQKNSKDELNWIWVAHYEGYKEGYWTATGDDRFTTDPDKLKEKNT